jgi:hypothetical protein
MSLEEALTAITSTINHIIDDRALDNDWVRLQWFYDAKENEVKLGFKKQIGSDTTYQLSFPMAPNSAFWELMNCPPDVIADFGIPQGLNYTWIFPNVWNRRDLYIHGSFVNYTKFRYLGRNNEFYPKPSKIYSFDDFQAMQFYFEVSFDAMRPVSFPYVNFEVELSFIIDAKKYQSE